MNYITGHIMDDFVNDIVNLIPSNYNPTDLKEGSITFKITNDIYNKYNDSYIVVNIIKRCMFIYEPMYANNEYSCTKIEFHHNMDLFSGMNELIHNRGKISARYRRFISNERIIIVDNREQQELHNTLGEDYWDGGDE